MKNLFTYCCYTIFLITIANTLHAQTSNIDSLQKAYVKATNNEQKVDVLMNIANHHAYVGNLDSFIYYGHELIKLYKVDNKIKEANRIEVILCQQYSRKGDYKGAYDCALKLEDYYNTSDDYASQSKVNALIASHYYINTKLDESIPYLLKTIQLHKEGKKADSWALQYSFQTLSVIYTVKNQYTEALKVSQENLKYTEGKEPLLRANALMGVAYLYVTLQDYKKSIPFYKEAIVIYEKIDENSNVDYTDLYRQIGSAYAQLDQNDSSFYYYQKAIELYKVKGDKENAANLLSILGYYEGKKSDHTQSNKYLQEALSMLDNESEAYKSIMHRENVNQLSFYLKDIGDKDLNTEEKTKLRNTLSEIAPMLEKYMTNSSIMLNVSNIEYFSVLANAYSKVDSFEKAFSFIQKSSAIRDSFYNANKLNEFSSFEADIAMEKERARLLFEEETKRINLQKEIELKALKFEYERKQALAKTEEERKRLMLEEDLKRKEIELKYEQEQKAITLKFEQEKALAIVEQEKREALAAAELSRSKNIRNMSLLGGGLAVVLLGLAIWSYLQKRKDNKRIAEEKHKSDELLLNILPQEVAEELKAKGSTEAKHHAEVSVLFTDFVNFTANSEKVGVQELLNELNICFTAFDKIMEKYGLEKIKTIGDAYLAVSGLPAASPRHAQNALKASLEIIDFIEKRKANNPNALAIRIGINSGPVIAGIVGVKKFAYDIWGDTVNTAARMEQSGEAGKINISESTYTLVQKEFNCTHRGKITAKGKGEVDMYFVEGK